MTNKKEPYLLVLALCLFLFWTASSFAQGTADDVEMAELMRSSGKIYVVVAVLSIIYVGIIFYLIKIDRQLTKLERKIEDTT
jgi:CcmD family protein